MCPACFASMALLIAGVIPASGALAVTARLLQKKKVPGKILRATHKEEQK